LDADMPLSKRQKNKLRNKVIKQYKELGGTSEAGKFSKFENKAVDTAIDKLLENEAALEAERRFDGFDSLSKSMMHNTENGAQINSAELDTRLKNTKGAIDNSKVFLGQAFSPSEATRRFSAKNSAEPDYTKSKKIYTAVEKTFMGMSAEEAKSVNNFVTEYQKINQESSIRRDFPMDLLLEKESRDKIIELGKEGNEVVRNQAFADLNTAYTGTPAPRGKALFESLEQRYEQRLANPNLPPLQETMEKVQEQQAVPTKDQRNPRYTDQTKDGYPKSIIDAKGKLEKKVKATLIKQYKANGGKVPRFGKFTDNTLENAFNAVMTNYKPEELNYELRENKNLTRLTGSVLASQNSELNVSEKKVQMDKVANAKAKSTEAIMSGVKGFIDQGVVDSSKQARLTQRFEGNNPGRFNRHFQRNKRERNELAQVQSGYRMMQEHFEDYNKTLQPGQKEAKLENVNEFIKEYQSLNKEGDKSKDFPLEFIKDPSSRDVLETCAKDIESSKHALNSINNKFKGALAKPEFSRDLLQMSMKAAKNQQELGGISDPNLVKDQKQAIDKMNDFVKEKAEKKAFRLPFIQKPKTRINQTAVHLIKEGVLSDKPIDVPKVGLLTRAVPKIFSKSKRIADAQNLKGAAFNVSKYPKVFEATKEALAAGGKKVKDSDVNKFFANAEKGFAQIDSDTRQTLAKMEAKLSDPTVMQSFKDDLKKYDGKKQNIAQSIAKPKTYFFSQNKKQARDLRNETDTIGKKLEASVEKAAINKERAAPPSPQVNTPPSPPSAQLNTPSPAAMGQATLVPPLTPPVTAPSPAAAQVNTPSPAAMGQATLVPPLTPPVTAPSPAAAQVNTPSPAAMGQATLAPQASGTAPKTPVTPTPQSATGKKVSFGNVETRIFEKGSAISEKSHIDLPAQQIKGINAQPARPGEGIGNENSSLHKTTQKPSVPVASKQNSTQSKRLFGAKSYGAMAVLSAGAVALTASTGGLLLIVAGASALAFGAKAARTAYNDKKYSDFKNKFPNIASVLVESNLGKAETLKMIRDFGQDKVEKLEQALDLQDNRNKVKDFCRKAGKSNGDNHHSGGMFMNIDPIWFVAEAVGELVGLAFDDSKSDAIKKNITNGFESVVQQFEVYQASNAQTAQAPAVQAQAPAVQAPAPAVQAPAPAPAPAVPAINGAEIKENPEVIYSQLPNTDKLQGGAQKSTEEANKAKYKDLVGQINGGLKDTGKIENAGAIEAGTTQRSAAKIAAALDGKKGNGIA